MFGHLLLPILCETFCCIEHFSAAFLCGLSVSIMEEKWSVDKLEGSTNWMTWKFQLRHLLMAKGLWKYVDGSAVLAERVAADVREKFQAEQQKAFSTIVMSVSSSLLYLITSCELPKRCLGCSQETF